ncbi:MAG: hypothetical protein ACFFD1_04780 [Candidatus Thorarchaeota archaeon]
MLNLTFPLKNGDKLRYPYDRWYKFSPNGAVWFKKKTEGKYFVGCDELTVYKCNEIIKLSLRKQNEIIKANKTLFRLETDQPGCCGNLLVKSGETPWNVKILEINQLIKQNPHIILRYPYDEGWIYQLEAIEPIFLKKEDNFTLTEIIGPNNPKLLNKKVISILKNYNLINFLS